MPKRLSNPNLFVSPSQPSAPRVNDVWIDSDEALQLSQGGFVAQPDAPSDTNVLWLDTDETTSVPLANADSVQGFRPYVTPTANSIPVLDSNALLPAASIGGAWTAWTPTVSSNTGTFTSISGAGFYTQIGKTVHFRLTISVTTVGTGGYPTFTLPITSKTGLNNTLIGSFREGGATGKFGAVALSSSSLAALFYYDNTGVSGNGYTYFCNGTYEAA